MRTRRYVGTLAVAALAALAASPLAGQDVTYRFSNEMKMGGAMDRIMSMANAFAGEEAQTRTEYLKGRLMRTDEGKASSTIISIEEARMYFLQHEEKTYFSLALDSIGAGIGAMAQGLQGAQVETEGTDQEESPTISFTVDVERTGERKRIAGYRSEQVFLTLEAERAEPVTGDASGMESEEEVPASRLVLLMELWMSDEVPGFQELKALQEEYASLMSQDGGAGDMGGAVLNLFTQTPGTKEALEQAGEEMMKLDGMAVESRTYIVTVPADQQFRRKLVLNPPEEGGRGEDVKKMAGSMLGGLFGGGKEESEEEESEPEDRAQKTVLTFVEELVEVETGSLSEDLFRVPAGYTEITGDGGPSGG